MGVDEVDTQNGIFMEVPDHVYLVGDVFLANLDLKVVDPSNVKGLTAGSMAGAGCPRFLRWT
jgi:hypothetical protein